MAKTTKPTTTTTTTVTTAVGEQRDYILLDRSGSMGGSKWVEALASINGYVEQLKKDKVDTKITVAFFDQHGIGCSFEIKRESVSPAAFRPLSNDDGSPRGGTPLNDATAKLLDLANASGADNVAITIMTDGEENASQEYTVPKIKDRLDVCRKKGWVITFLGANFDNVAQATSYGNMASNTATVSINNLRASGSMLASKRATYGATGQSASMDFSDDEKEQLKK